MRIFKRGEKTKKKEGRYRLPSFVKLAGISVLLFGAAITWHTFSVSAAPSSRIVYSTDGGNSWSSTLTARSGQDILTRLYFNNDTQNAITDAQMSTTLPAGFSLSPNSTRTCLNPGTADPTAPSAELECNDAPEQGGAIDESAVWAGDGLSIAPNAGIYGEATNATSGLMAAGKKRYLNLHQCARHTSQAYDWITVAIDNPAASAWYAGTNASNTADSAVDCGTETGGWTLHSTISSVQNLDLLGKRYVNTHQCLHYLADSTNGNRYLTTLTNTPAAAQWATGTNTSNTADSTVNCATPGSSWTYHAGISGVQPLDTLNDRYVNLHECLRVHSSGFYLSAFIHNPNGTGWRTGTNASNGPDTSVTCPTVNANWSTHSTLSNVQAIDTLDTTRGQGFVEYKMQAATVAEPQTFEQDASLTGTGTGDPSSSGSLTIEPDLQLVYSTDNGATWTTDPDVSSGATMLVRAFSYNKRTTTLNNTQLSTTLPAGFNLKPGTTKVCLNPGTTDATTPNADVLCNDSAGQGGAIDEGAVWAGRDLTISPTAGLFGEATNATSGYLAAGKKKYANLHQCIRHTDPAYDWITVAIDDPINGAWYAGTNASNTADGTVDCGEAGWTTHATLSGVQNLDLFANRYINLNNCNATLTDATNGARRLTTLINNPAASVWATDTNTSNVADTAATCGTHGSWTNHPTLSDVQSLEILENRYVNIHECIRVASSPSQYLSMFIEDPPAVAWRTGTKASNTPDTNLDCPVVNTNWTNHATLSDFQVLDLLDVNRGQVFAEFEVTAPSPQMQTEYTHKAGLTGTGTGDQTAEDTITVLVDPGVIITETDGSTNVTEGGASDTIQVQLTAPPSTDVTLTITDDNGQQVTIPTVTFTPSNWDTPQTVTITAIDDNIIEGPHTDNLNYTTSSSDTAFDGLNGDDVVTVNITDNDAPGATVIVTNDVTSEDGDTGEFCIALLTQPSADVTIALSSSNTGEVTVPPSITIPVADWDNASANCVTTTGVDDGSLGDGLQTVTITTGNVTSSDANYNALDGSTIDDVTMYNQNNDPPGFAVDVISGVTTEDGGTATVQFRLLSQPDGGADVTIPLSIDDTSEGTLSGVTSITIANADWDNGAANQVTITGVDDDMTDGDIIYHLVSGDPTSSDPVYDAFTAADIVNPLLTNVDTDVAGATITPTGDTTDIIEGGATDTVDVVLNTRPAPGNVVVITVQPQPQLDVGAGPGTAIQLTFDTNNWNTPQTITVGANDDNQLEGTHNANIGYLVDTGTTTEQSYKSVTGIPATDVAITDNDTAAASIARLDDAAENPANNGHFRVTLSKQNSTGSPITVNYTVSGTATAGSDYAPLTGSVAIPSGASSADITVNVTGMDDNLLEGTQTITVTLDSTDNAQVTISATNQATVGIADDEVQTASASMQVAQNGSEDGPTDVIYEVALTNQNETGAPIVLSINPSGGSAIPGTDYDDFSGQTISIPNGATSGTYAVRVIDNNLVEGTQTVRATIGNPSLVGLAISNTYAVATIDDNDAASVNITATDDTAAENTDDHGEFTIKLSAPNNSSDPLTISYDVSGSATADTDYAPLSGEIEIPVGEDSATITVDTTGYDDTEAEGNESVIVTLTGTNNPSFTLGTPVGAMVVITDSDKAPQPKPEPEPQPEPELEPTPAPTEQPAEEEAPWYFWPFIAQERLAEEEAEEKAQKEEVKEEREQNETKTADDDGDGIENGEEDKALNNGDGNGDGIPDREQPNVASIISSVTTKPVTLAVEGECQRIHSFGIVAEVATEDPDYTYPRGLFDFELSCTEPSQSATVTLYLDTTQTTDWTWRKFNRFNQAYATVKEAQFGTAQIGNGTITTVTYEITDGDDLDEDSAANGIILDPIGPGIRTKGSSLGWWWLLLLLPIFIVFWILYRKRRFSGNSVQ